MYTYTATNTSINILFRGKMFNLSDKDSNFNDVREFLKVGLVDDDHLEELLDKAAHIRKAVGGIVEIKHGEVFYDGHAVHNTLTDKLLTLLEEGFDVEPWANFMHNLMQNPSYKSRKALFDFLEKWQAPITPDGCFIAFKNVRSNFMDIHSGTMDNSPGRVVSMLRSEVDDDSSNTCSAGLHACATSYLSSFYSNGSKTVIVKINPRDVCAVPNDYNFAKMRVCSYEVLCEVEKEDIESVASTPMYQSSSILDEYEESAWLDTAPYDDSYDNSSY